MPENEEATQVELQPELADQEPQLPDFVEKREDAYYHQASGDKYSIVELIETVLIAYGAPKPDKAASRILKEIAQTDEGRQWILGQGFTLGEDLIKRLSLDKENRSWLVKHGYEPTPVDELKALFAAAKGGLESAF